MATSIAASFDKFKSNLEITGLQASTVSTRQQAVRKSVENGLTVVDSFLTGSYARHTMIAPLKEADVDIFVVLSSAYHKQYTPAALLDKVRDVVKVTYPSTPKISRNGQAVTITFKDFVVDVVPAFNRQGGGFLIPSSSTGKWIETDPKVHIDTISASNTWHKGDLVPVIKMIKAWNKAKGSPIKSFYLEMLVHKVLTNVTISDYGSGVRFVLDKGRETIKFTIKDPAPMGGDIQPLASGTLDQAVARFTTAHSQAVTAEAHGKAGNVSTAVAEWRKIFGDYFPAYG